VNIKILVCQIIGPAAAGSAGPVLIPVTANTVVARSGRLCADVQLTVESYSFTHSLLFVLYYSW